MYKHLDVGLLKLVLTFLLVIPVLSPIANGQDTTRDLQKAVHQLNFWVATQKNKLELRRQLDMNTLETQAAEGHRANLSQLHMLLQKFQNSDAPDHPAVQEVTGALQNHLSNLSRQIGQDIGYVIAVAKTRYQTISLEQLERRRNEAVRDLKSLKAFYRKSIYSRERASIFYDLKIDESVAITTSLDWPLVVRLVTEARFALLVSPNSTRFK